MCNYIVKVRDTRRDEYRIILTPKLTEKTKQEILSKSKLALINMMM